MTPRPDDAASRRCECGHPMSDHLPLRDSHPSSNDGPCAECERAECQVYRPDDAAAPSKKRRCVAEMGGHRCEKPMGHFGDHYALWLEGRSERSAYWTEVDGMVNYREQWRPVRG